MKNLFPQFSLPSKTTGYSEHPSTNRVKAKSLRATSVWSLYTDEHTESPLSCERTRDRKKERKARKRHFSRRLFSPMIRFFFFCRWFLYISRFIPFQPLATIRLLPPYPAVSVYSSRNSNGKENLSDFDLRPWCVSPRWFRQYRNSSSSSELLAVAEDHGEAHDE